VEKIPDFVSEQRRDWRHLPGAGGIALAGSFRRAGRRRVSRGVRPGRGVCDFISGARIAAAAFFHYTHTVERKNAADVIGSACAGRHRFPHRPRCQRRASGRDAGGCGFHPPVRPGRGWQWDFSSRRAAPRELVSTRAGKGSFWRSASEQPDEDLSTDEFVKSEVDPILDKISRQGIQSLTAREREILEKARERMAKH